MLTRLMKWIRHPTDIYDIDEFYDERTLYRVYSYFGGLFTLQHFVDSVSGNHCSLRWTKYLPIQSSFEVYCFMGHMAVTFGRLDLFKEPHTYTAEDLEQIGAIINEYAKRKPIDGL